MFSKLFATAEASYSLRYIAAEQVRLGPGQAATELARNSFKYRATRQWNSLPQDIRKSSTLSSYKGKLKAWIVNNVPVS